MKRMQFKILPVLLLMLLFFNFAVTGEEIVVSVGEYGLEVNEFEERINIRQINIAGEQNHEEEVIEKFVINMLTRIEIGEKNIELTDEDITEHIDWAIVTSSGGSLNFEEKNESEKEEQRRTHAAHLDITYNELWEEAEAGLGQRILFNEYYPEEAEERFADGSDDDFIEKVYQQYLDDVGSSQEIDFDSFKQQFESPLLALIGRLIFMENITEHSERVEIVIAEEYDDTNIDYLKEYEEALGLSL